MFSNPSSIFCFACNYKFDDGNCKPVGSSYMHSYYRPCNMTLFCSSILLYQVFHGSICDYMHTSIYHNLGCSVVDTCDHSCMCICHSQACNCGDICDYRCIDTCLNQACNIVGNAWHKHIDNCVGQGYNTLGISCHRYIHT